MASSQGVHWKVAVSNLEAIIEDLKALPPDRLDSAADYIHKIKTISHLERAAIIDRTSGSLTKEEGDDLARAIDEGCEQVDERDSIDPGEVLVNQQRRRQVDTVLE